MLHVRGRGFVKVNDPPVVLFDVLAVLDAFCALLTAAAILCFSMLGMKTWIFRESVFHQDPQVSKVPQVVQPSLERSFSGMLGT